MKLHYKKDALILHVENVLLPKLQKRLENYKLNRLNKSLINRIFYCDCLDSYSNLYVIGKMNKINLFLRVIKSNNVDEFISLDENDIDYLEF